MNSLRTVALVVLAAALSGTGAGADIIEQILVKVNGEIITKSELEQRQIAAIRQRPEVQTLRGDDAALAKLLSDVTPDVIVDAVDELLMLQRGKELGYAMNDEQFKGIVENIRKENKIETEEQFNAALKQEGMTMLDLRRQLEKQMLVTRVQQAEVMGKVSVSEDEVKSHYESNRDAFTSPAQLTLREILIAVPTTEAGVNVAADETARAKAEQVHARLVAGEPFARLAAELSDAPSKANGGLLGEIPRSDMAPDLQTAVDPLKPGDVTAVLRTSRGYQILKVDDRTGGTPKTMEEAREQISDQVFDAKRRAEFQKYLTRLREQAIIEWKNEEVKKAWQTGLATRTTGTDPERF